MNTQPEAQAAELHQAFSAFNQLSTQLRESYELLQTRVVDLTAELANAQDARLSELAEKEKLADRLSALLSGLPAGVVVLGANGQIQDYNPAAAELLGEPLAGVAWRDIIARAFTPRPNDGHDVSLRDGRRVSVSTCPLQNEPGQIVLLTDVTETRKLQEQAHHNQRLAAMGQMAAALAHQIRTPLSSALLYSSNLRRATLADAERQRCAEKIIARLKHLENLVRDMLLYARDGACVREELSVAVLLRAFEQALEAQLESSDIRLRITDQSEGARVDGNFDMLLSALGNLAANAIEAMGGDGLLQLVARRYQGEYVDLLIVDTGPGLSIDAQRTIFEPFHTTRSRGTGLGLAVVAAIADAHQGDVWVRSEPGRGSTFAIRLPCVQQPRRDQDKCERRRSQPALHPINVEM